MYRSGHVAREPVWEAWSGVFTTDENELITRSFIDFLKKKGKKMCWQGAKVLWCMLTRLSIRVISKSFYTFVAYFLVRGGSQCDPVEWASVTIAYKRPKSSQRLSSQRFTPTWFFRYKLEFSEKQTCFFRCKLECSETQSWFFRWKLQFSETETWFFRYKLNLNVPQNANLNLRELEPDFHNT